MDTHRFPKPPQTGDLIDLPQADARVMTFLATRRSSGKATLGAPGPDDESLKQILEVGARVPDHRRVEPWRFIVITGDSRDAFAGVLRERFVALNPDAPDADVAAAGAAAHRAPVTVFVVSSPDRQHKTPIWEQEMSAGAVCHQLCLAAQATGFGAVWLSEWPCEDHGVAAALGLKGHERLVGQILIGSPTTPSPERPRPDTNALTHFWSPGRR